MTVGRAGRELISYPNVMETDPLPGHWETDEYFKGLAKAAIEDGELHVEMQLVTEVVIPEEYRDTWSRDKVAAKCIERMLMDIQKDLRAVLMERLRQIDW